MLFILGKSWNGRPAENELSEDISSYCQDQEMACKPNTACCCGYSLPMGLVISSLSKLRLCYLDVPQFCGINYLPLAHYQCQARNGAQDEPTSSLSLIADIDIGSDCYSGSPISHYLRAISDLGSGCYSGSGSPISHTMCVE